MTTKLKIENLFLAFIRARSKVLCDVFSDKDRICREKVCCEMSLNNNNKNEWLWLFNVSGGTVRKSRKLSVVF